jgi:hypothetical protein
MFDGYKGGPLMNPLARIQESKTMTPQEALDTVVVYYIAVTPRHS